MRLLYHKDTGKLAWKNFIGEPVSPYAILSHRWGLDEVLFEDLVANKFIKKAGGWKKIQFCTERAAQDGLKYFWVDTCCINEWDLRELSNAINSIFKWYQDANRYYVYLTDVFSAPTNIRQQISRTPSSLASKWRVIAETRHSRFPGIASTSKDLRSQVWETSFRTSNWFTRGWTLQELIAPASVEFFCSEGHRLGDKAELGKLLHEITAIPPAALRGESLRTFSVSERKAWAAKRETSEPEDAAYCLLGLLDVQMSLTYGDEALRAVGAPTIIPFSQNDRFVGREAELADLEAKLFDSGQMTNIAILGDGGTGKSQLALQLIHRIREKDKARLVFWIDAGDADEITQGCSSIAQSSTS